MTRFEQEISEAFKRWRQTHRNREEEKASMIDARNHHEKQHCSAGYHDVEPGSFMLQPASRYAGSSFGSLHFLYGSGVVRLLRLGDVFKKLLFRLQRCWNDTGCR